MRTKVLHFGRCPSCGAETQVGVLRCIAKHDLFWDEGNKVSLRRQPIQWNQVIGKVHFRDLPQLSSRQLADDTSVEVTQLRPAQAVEIVNEEGDYYKLRDGSYVHHTHIVLFRRKKPMWYGVVSTSGIGRGSLDQPQWPANAVTTFVGGEAVQVYEIKDGYARILPVDSEWFHTSFIDRVLWRGKVIADGRGSLEQPTWPSNVVRTLARGDQVVVFEEKDGYCRISAVHAEWFHSSFLRK